MSHEFTDALIALGRGIFAAGVSAAVVYVGANYMSTPPADLAKGAVIAFLTGAILFLGAFLRNTTTDPLPVTKAQLDVETAGAHRTRTRSWADNLPF